MAYRKDILLQMGTIASLVNVETAVTKDATGLKTVCVGDTAKPHPPAAIRQKQECPTCGNDDRGSFKKAQVDGTEFTVVEAGEVATAKETAIGASKQVIQLSAHQAEEVSTRTVQDGSVYFLTPAKPALAPVYGLIADTMARHPELTFLGQWTPASRTNLYQFKAFGTTLVMEERARPDALRIVQQPATPVGQAHRDQIDLLLPSLVSEFDPATYADAYATRLAELLASKQAVEGVAAARSKTATTLSPVGTVDLTALLNDALSTAGVS